MSAPATSAFPISDVRFPALTEADLSALWEGQRFPRGALICAEAGQLRVIYRGRRTGGPGPDFRDAIIATGSELLQGDVELHVRSSDFRRHGHHRDPAYDRLALHVVFRHDEGHPTELACGRRVPVAALGNWAASRAGELRRRLAGPPLWQEPCHTAVERLGAVGAETALDRLGDMRFRQKAAAAAKESQQLPAGGRARLPNGSETENAARDELLWRGIVEALGFGGQRELMLAVAEHLGWGEVRAAMEGVSGRERRIRAYRLLIVALEEQRLHVPLVLAPLRPGNRPERRLKGAATIAARYAGAGLWAALAPLVAEAAAGRPARLIASLVAPGAIGRARAIELLTNAVLPVAAVAGSREAEAAFRALPLPARYGAVRHIRAALGGAVRLNTRRQQGMLYLLKQYCTQGGCGRCPLS
jgi:hypothetical protein